MRLFGLEIRKSKGAPAHSLTDEEREMGLEVRKMKQEQRRIQHQIELTELKVQLAEAEAELEELEGDDEGGDAFDAMAKVALNKILGGGAAPVSSPPLSPMTVSLSDAAIEENIKQIPENYRKIARKLDNATIASFLKKKTNFDDETIDRAVKIFREKNL